MSAPMILAESEVDRIIRLSLNAEFARAYLEKGIRVLWFCRHPPVGLTQ